jgi:membrane associated rhomboid family serine protease
VSKQQSTGSSSVPVCYRHAGQETYVRCLRCNRPICPDCMNEAPVGFQCPQCVGAGNRTVRQARTAFGSSLHGERGYATIALIAVNVLVFVGTLVLGGTQAAIGQGSNLLFAPSTEVSSLLGVSPPAVAHGEYWRLFTAMFIHFGVLHIAMNMWALWILGRYLERALGPARFTALYFLCGFGGNCAIYLFSSTSSLAGGASTALFGLFAVMFLVNRKLGLSNHGLIVLIVINLVLTFAVPNISILGHLGGLVTGAMAGFGVTYAPPSSRTPSSGTTVQVLVLSGIAALFVVLTLVRTLMLLSGV